MATINAAASIPIKSRLRFTQLNFGNRNWESLIRSKENFRGCWKSLVYSSQRQRRRTPLCAANKDAEKAFMKTVELDRLIDTMRDSNPREKDYEELATSVMGIVDRLVHKTEEKIETSTDVLKAILKPVLGEHEEVSWPPRDPEALKLMEQELSIREQEGYLDESFLSEVNAQLRQAREDGDKPGLLAMLQVVLQLYASKVLQKRSYAYNRGGEVIPREKFLESIIEAPESSWNKLLIDGLTIGKGEIKPEDLYAAVKKRIERVLIRTEGGSYEQRVLVEYLKGIESRAQEVVQALQGGLTQ